MRQDPALEQAIREPRDAAGPSGLKHPLPVGSNHDYLSIDGDEERQPAQPD